MKADDMTQLARFAYDMALTAPEDVIKRQALFNAYMKLHDEVRAALAPAAHGAGEVEAIRERVE